MMDDSCNTKIKIDIQKLLTWIPIDTENERAFDAYEDEGWYHCTDDRRTTMLINACVKISARRRPVYAARKLRRRTNYNGKWAIVHNNPGAQRNYV